MTDSELLISPQTDTNSISRLRRMVSNGKNCTKGLASTILIQSCCDTLDTVLFYLLVSSYHGRGCLKLCTKLGLKYLDEYTRRAIFY